MRGLLLTPKARIIAPLVVWRRAEDDFLLLTEPGRASGGPARCSFARASPRSAPSSRADTSCVILGAGELVSNRHELAVSNHDYGIPAVELIDADPPEGSQPISDDEVERLRILARTPRLGAELDDRVMPAEAGLEERAISFTKGC